jgi:hypothetical protein
VCSRPGRFLNLSLILRICLGLLCPCFVGVALRSQDTQFLPEIDAHLTINSYMRAYLQAKDDREGGDPEQFTFGPSIQFYLKSRPMVLESGYRIITAPNTANENRATEAVTFHVPLVLGLLAYDRNRTDLDWKNGLFTWRYRNKLTVERTVSVASYHLIPYVAAEPFYESQYNKWSATDLYAGSVFPVGRHVEFNLYYEHENDTGKRPNRQNNYVGLCLYLFFSMKEP